jgi:hypothetical protein
LKKNKVKIEIFFPFGSCACSSAPLLEKVGRVALNFKDAVDFEMKSTGSKEALQYAIKNSGEIVNGIEKLAQVFDEKQLEEAIIKRLNIH